MDDHARKDHNSTIQTCFANTALIVSLVAAASLEDIAGAKQGSRRIENALRDVGEFLAVVNPEVRDGRRFDSPPETALAAFISEQGVMGKAGLHYAFDLGPEIPAVFDSIQKSWSQLGEEGRSQYKGELRERLNSFASYPVELTGFSSNADALFPYSKLSPRLHKWMREYAIPNSTRGPDFMASLATGELERGFRRIQRTSRGVSIPDIPLRDRFEADP